MNDLISRQAALRALKDALFAWSDMPEWRDKKIVEAIVEVPTAQPDPLTDKEQRIFLSAMAREEKICEELNRKHLKEPYADSLMRVCKEIRRKVKGTLWT